MALKPSDIKEESATAVHADPFAPVRTLNAKTGTVTLRFPGAISEIILDDDESGIVHRAYMKHDGHLGVVEAY